MTDRKNDIIPANQGFGKGGCITDHLVKLARHINSFQGEEVFWPHSFMLKRLDYKLKNIAITDVMFRLDYKLKNIAITDVMFHYIKNFFSERCICTRVGKTYSSNKKIDTGIPQDSVIAPTLFTILTHDLPKHY